MTLQNLLEHKRYEWQKHTQDDILNSLLCKAHRFKAIGQSGDRLVMVFGKSHSGKTTFILSLMGISEDKIQELNFILRAGVPEGKSSTSTAIIYQMSDDDKFGFCERGINIIDEVEILKCEKNEFIKRIQEIRDSVETHNRDKDCVLYLYIPKLYFDQSELNKNQINILDVPGYETTNQEEWYHTEALLNKYMSVSVLNIVVRSIYDINDLRYFRAPNRDDFSKLTSSKYIIVTTRAYSQESIFKHFLKPRNERTISFEEMLERECQCQFERVFGENVPAYFPVDLGESYYELVNTKITDPEDREELINYRSRTFDKILEKIYSKQSNTLLSWVQELIEDEEYYREIELAKLEAKSKALIEVLGIKKETICKCRKDGEKLQSNLDNVLQETDELVLQKSRIKEISTEPLTNDIMNVCSEEAASLTSKRKSFSDCDSEANFFANLFSEKMFEFLDKLMDEFDFLFSAPMRYKWNEEIEETEILIKNQLEELMKPHKILIFFNPSNKDKINLGQKKLTEYIDNLSKQILEDVILECDSQIVKKKKNGVNSLTILVRENQKKINALEREIRSLENENSNLDIHKKEIDKRVINDKKVISKYMEIAKNNYDNQRKYWINAMNDTVHNEDKVEYLIFLGLMEKDYRKIVMEW